MITSLCDTACGYAALSQMPPERAVLSVEFKINLLKPAAGAAFEALGKVLRAGRTLTVCTAEAWAIDHGERRLIAAMQGTMIALDRQDLSD